MSKKSFIITSIVTVSLFVFVSFLLYVIYCFSFYDSNQENEYLLNFNSESYDFVYDHMNNKNYISKNSFNYSVNLMFRKNKLKEIYNLYYSDLNEDDFINNYYYGNNISLEDIEFIKDGKTNLFKRRTIEYASITIWSRSGNKSSFGVKNNLKLKVGDNSKITIDEVGCEIKNNTCIISYILGGLHTVKYKVEDVEYFGLLNVINNNSEIDISNLDSLVRINNDQEIEDDIDINLNE